MVGPYSDPTAGEAMRAARIGGEEGLVAREALRDLCRACRGGYDGEIVEAAKKLYRALEGA